MKKLLFVVAFFAILVSVHSQVMVKASKYHPGRGGSGWYTASGDRIDNNKLKRYEIRWVALSPDLYRTLGVKINDTVEIECPTNYRLNGKWVVKDRMSSRLRNSIDLLLPAGDTMRFTSRTEMLIKKAE